MSFLRIFYERYTDQKVYIKIGSYTYDPTDSCTRILCFYFYKWRPYMYTSTLHYGVALRRTMRVEAKDKRKGLSPISGMSSRWYTWKWQVVDFMTWWAR